MFCSDNIYGYNTCYRINAFLKGGMAIVVPARPVSTALQGILVL